MDEVFDRVIDNQNRKKPVIITDACIPFPMSIGILGKYILLPDKKYNEKIAYYILKHEYIHLKNGDLIIKVFVEIMGCFFWWNPFYIYLRQDIEQMMEIRCDAAVLKGLNHKEKTEYLEMILSMLKENSQKKTVHKTTGMLNFLPSDSDYVKERFSMVSKQHNVVEETWKKMLIFCTFFAMLVLSYAFVIQPSFEAPVEEIAEEDGICNIEILDCYIVEEIDGNFYAILPDGEREYIEKQSARKLQEVGFEIVRMMGEK